MTDKIFLPDNVKASLLTSSFIEDFTGATHCLNETEGDAAGDVALDADGLDGRLLLTVTTTNNEEAYAYSNELFKFSDRRPFSVIGRLQYTEGNTDDANVLFGVGEGFGAANTLLDDGAGPPADYDGACFYKVDGGTRWIFESSVGTSQVTTELDYTAGGSSFVTFGIDFVPISSTEIEITPWIDTAGGNNLLQCRAYNVNPRVPLVKHTRTFSSVGEMALCVGLKNGAANSEAVILDLVGWAARRV